METLAIRIRNFSFSHLLSLLKFPFAAKPPSSSRLIAVIALLFPLAVSLPAQQPLSLADAALRGQTIFDQSAVTGMVLVAVRGKEVMVKGYGETSPGSGRAPDSNSLIRLCSLSKVLTADLLLKLVADGKVALTDPLQVYAPRGKVVPRGADGSQITLGDLATHTSGLPREVGAYPAKTPHFTFPDHTFRWTWLPRRKLTTPPGTAAVYSNVGFDLLGDALASATGETYAKLLHDRLLQPLNMWDTTLFPSIEQCARLLQPTGDQGPCTDTGASGASAGFYSTPANMVKLLEYLLQTPGSPVRPPAELSVALQPQQLKSVQGLSHAGDPTGIGLAWIQIGDPNSPSKVIEKTGGGAGFTTYIALSPGRQTGIFLAATDGKGEAQIDFFKESNNLLAALANVPPLPPKMRNGPKARRNAKRRHRTAAEVQSQN
jgi:D-alanyl-D-alanine-carboxypeptidase/D-alanyl-D-alanine-endopeptidase